MKYQASKCSTGLKKEVYP